MTCTRRSTTNTPADPAPPSTCKCKNCQCNLQSVQHANENRCHQQNHLQQKQLHDNHHRCTSSEKLRHTSSSGPAITSLSSVYLCLGILTLALASLSVLFYSHVTSCSAMCDMASSSPSSFAGFLNCPNSTSSSSINTADNYRGLHRRAVSADDAESYVDKFSAQEEEEEAKAEDFLSTSAGTSSSSPLLFRERFRQELLASEHMLALMVERILQQQISATGEEWQQHNQPRPDHHQQQQHQGHLEHANKNYIPLGNFDDQR